MGSGEDASPLEGPSNCNSDVISKSRDEEVGGHLQVGDEKLPDTEKQELHALQQFHKSLRAVRNPKAGGNSSSNELKNMLSFENLTVLVPESGWKTCSCLNSPLRHYASDYMGVAVERTEAFWAMEGISGHLASGELMLVLSSNALASSTLMRALTGRLSRTRDQMSGSLLWNGLPLHEHDLQPWRRVTPYVSSRDDSHAAVLTVRETLQFAAECSAGDKAPAATIVERVDQLMKALGIDHVADTVVGDENLRGISGGQKRRVTVGEMLLNPEAKCFGLENITDGRTFMDIIYEIGFGFVLTFAFLASSCVQ